MITRRKLLKYSLATTALELCAPMINKGQFQLYAQSTQMYSERAIKLIRESLVIDILHQFKSVLKTPSEELSKWLSKPGTFTEVDMQKFRESGVNIFGLGHDTWTYEDALTFFAKWNGFIAGYSQWLMRIDSVKALDQVKATNKLGILLSLQTSNHFRTLDDVDSFFGLGQRISQLTYNRASLIGSGFWEDRDGGLTEFGNSIVERMNKVGMGIDVSHCGDQTTLDSLEASKQPVLFTHAGCRALVSNSMRNKTDEMIKKMAAKGGVMGIAFLRFMIHGQEPVSVEHLLDHFDYVTRLVGIEHVGIGSDFGLETDDQYLTESKELVAKVMAADKRNRYAFHVSDTGLVGVEGVNHPKRIYDLTEGLIRRKYSDANIKLILGENFKRALSTIWTV